MRLSDSADRTFANYGHEFKLKLALKNQSPTTRSIKISFAHRIDRIVTGKEPSHTYNGPMQVNGNRVLVFTTPSSPTQTLLSGLSIAPGTSKTVSIDFFAPGLITIGHQLILEAS